MVALHDDHVGGSLVDNSGHLSGERTYTKYLDESLCWCFNSLMLTNHRCWTHTIQENAHHPDLVLCAAYVRNEVDAYDDCRNTTKRVAGVLYKNTFWSAVTMSRVSITFSSGGYSPAVLQHSSLKRSNSTFNSPSVVVREYSPRALF